MRVRGIAFTAAWTAAHAFAESPSKRMGSTKCSPCCASLQTQLGDGGQVESPATVSAKFPGGALVQETRNPEKPRTSPQRTKPITDSDTSQTQRRGHRPDRTTTENFSSRGRPLSARVGELGALGSGPGPWHPTDRGPGSGNSDKYRSSWRPAVRRVLTKWTETTLGTEARARHWARASWQDWAPKEKPSDLRTKSTRNNWGAPLNSNRIWD